MRTTMDNFLAPLDYEVFLHSPGDDDIELEDGDIIFTYNHSAFVSKVIAWVTGEELSHCAVATSSEGYIAEALEWGIEYEHISKYRETHTYYVVRFDDLLYRAISDKAEAIAQSPSRARYGYVTLASIGITLLANKLFKTKRHFYFSLAGTTICSAYVAECLKTVGYHNHEVPSSYVTPAGLAKDIGFI